MGRLPIPEIARFLSKIRVDERTGCWLWQGGILNSGYGQFNPTDKFSNLAHRFAYRYYIGVINKGENVCHKCDTPRCCNPEHLFKGSQADNLNDMRRKGRASPTGPSGLKSATVKLNETQVFEIFTNKIESHADLAKRYGISATAISKIRNGTTWSTVTSKIKGN